MRLHLQLRALQREGGARRARALRRHDAVRAADGVAHADPGRPRGVSRSSLREVRRRRRAAQPGGDRAGADGVGPDHPRRLRPDRDDRADRQLARPAGEAGLDGPAAAGLRRRAARCRRPGVGDEGEICLALDDRAARPDAAATQDDDAKTSDAMRGGYYHTGDIASRDADGYLTFVGRADDVFKASDYRISPFELESVLIEHPAVAEAAVVPSPDPLRLAVPKAFVDAGDGLQPVAASSPPTIFAHCRNAARAVQAHPADRVRASCRRRSPARSAASSCARSRPSGAPPASAARTSTSRKTSSRGLYRFPYWRGVRLQADHRESPAEAGRHVLHGCEKCFRPRQT